MIDKDDVTDFLIQELAYNEEFSLSWGDWEDITNAVWPIIELLQENNIALRKILEISLVNCKEIGKSLDFLQLEELETRIRKVLEDTINL